MLTLAVYTRAGETAMRAHFAASTVDDLAAAGRAFLETPFADDDLDRYEITDTTTGEVVTGRDRQHRPAPKVAVGERVAYCVADGDRVVVVEGRVAKIGPAPHAPDGPPCYHVRVSSVLCDCRRYDLAAAIVAYPPTSTPAPGAPGGVSIARVDPPAPA